MFDKQQCFYKRVLGIIVSVRCIVVYSIKFYVRDSRLAF